MMVVGAILGMFVVPEAHDFWLQPSEYWINPDTLDSMTLQGGSRAVPAALTHPGTKNHAIPSNCSQRRSS
jgi:hypothetical protein